MAAFKKLKVLGSGAYGIVYLATSATPQKDLPEQFAIKSATRELSSYLQKEETILESLAGCPEILQCYGIRTTEEEGQSFYNLLLEYAPHGTLHDLIEEQEQPLTESQARVYTRMILKGLSAIHEKGFVHCDLKPANILLFPPRTQGSAEAISPKTQDSAEDGTCYQAKIGDFGLAKTKEEGLWIDRDEWQNKYRGTLDYVSPESLVFGRIEAVLDVWSLGCIVIEMLTGESPWEEVSEDEQLIKILSSLVEAPKIPDEASEVCRDFLTKCFVKNPYRRWKADMLLDHPFVKF